jgi:hypothetical protein
MISGSGGGDSISTGSSSGGNGQGQPSGNQGGRGPGSSPVVSGGMYGGSSAGGSNGGMNGYGNRGGLGRIIEGYSFARDWGEETQCVYLDIERTVEWTWFPETNATRRRSRLVGRLCNRGTNPTPEWIRGGLLSLAAASRRPLGTSRDCRSQVVHRFVACRRDMRYPVRNRMASVCHRQCCIDASNLCVTGEFGCEPWDDSLANSKLDFSLLGILQGSQGVYRAG